MEAHSEHYGRSHNSSSVTRSKLSMRSSPAESVTNPTETRNRSGRSDGVTSSPDRSTIRTRETSRHSPSSISVDVDRSTVTESNEVEPSVRRSPRVNSSSLDANASKKSSVLMSRSDRKSPSPAARIASRAALYRVYTSIASPRSGSADSDGGEEVLRSSGFAVQPLVDSSAPSESANSPRHNRPPCLVPTADHPRGTDKSRVGAVHTRFHPQQPGPPGSDAQSPSTRTVFAETTVASIVEVAVTVPSTVIHAEDSTLTATLYATASSTVTGPRSK